MNDTMSATMNEPARAPAEQGVGARGGMVWSLRYANVAAAAGAGLNDKEQEHHG